MMLSVDSAEKPSPTLAYIAASTSDLCHTDIDDELQAIESLGWHIVPVALHPAEHSPNGSFSFAQSCFSLQHSGTVQRSLAGLAAAVQLGKAAAQCLPLLMKDMVQLGWARPRSWLLVGRWLAAARVARLLRDRRCTHVHAHGANEPAHVAMYAATMCGLTFTCTAYDRDLFRHSLLIQEVATRSSGLITSSHYNKHWLQARGVNAAHIAVVRHSPRQAPPSRAPGSRLADPGFTRQRVRNGPYRIGMLCDLLERHGVDDVLEALARLIRQGCAPVKLVIAGMGPERLRLQVQADRLHIHNCVEFAGDIAPNAVQGWLNSLDLFVAASKPDRYGIAGGIPAHLIQAMAAGVPVVATDVTGIPELVMDQKTGFVAQPGDPDSIAERIDQAMSDPDRARALAHAGRAHVRWEFGREVNLRRLVSHFGAAAEQETDPADSVEQAA